MYFCLLGIAIYAMVVEGPGQDPSKMMQYSKFQQLIAEGEKAHIDFKITCEAFSSKSKAANAELAKDICAMANNGNIASYIIIGVSDDRTQFNSVKNHNLADDNLQDFCKKNIYPPPKVKLHRLKWTRVPPEHAGKEFVIIQVGPQARQAFRLNQDFINYGEGYCFRRNEVWIRRGATSDLAAPEEIARLVRGKAPVESKPDYTVTTYIKLPKHDQVKAVAADFNELLAEIGGYVSPIPSTNEHVQDLIYDYYETKYVVLPIRDVKFVWRSIFVQETTQYGIVGGSPGLANRWWHCEHGVLLFNIGTIRNNHYYDWALDNIHYKSNWGWFTILDGYHLSAVTMRFSLLNIRRTRVATFAILALPNISSTIALRNAFMQLLKLLETDDAAFEHVLDARNSINAYLQKVQKSLGHSQDIEAKQAQLLIEAVLDLSKD